MATINQLPDSLPCGPQTQSPALVTTTVHNLLTYHTYQIPDIPRHALLLGLCAVPASQAGPEKLGWHITDFLSWKALLIGHGGMKSQTWLSGCDVAQIVKARPEDYLHGGTMISLKDGRNLRERTVVKRAIAASFEPVSGVVGGVLREDGIQVVHGEVEREGDLRPPLSEEETCLEREYEIAVALKKRFLGELCELSAAAKALVIFLCGPANLEQDVCLFSQQEGGIEKVVWISAWEIREAMAQKKAIVVLVSPAPFGTGWFVNPSLCLRTNVRVRADREEFLVGQLRGLLEKQHDSGKHAFNFDTDKDDWERYFGPREGSSLVLWLLRWDRKLQKVYDDGKADEGSEKRLDFLGEAFGGRKDSQIFHLRHLHRAVERISSRDTSCSRDVQHRHDLAVHGEELNPIDRARGDETTLEKTFSDLRSQATVEFVVSLSAQLLFQDCGMFCQSPTETAPSQSLLGVDMLPRTSIINTELRKAFDNMHFSHQNHIGSTLNDMSETRATIASRNLACGLSAVKTIAVSHRNIITTFSTYEKAAIIQRIRELIRHTFHKWQDTNSLNEDSKHDPLLDLTSKDDRVVKEQQLLKAPALKHPVVIKEAIRIASTIHTPPPVPMNPSTSLTASASVASQMMVVPVAEEEHEEDESHTLPHLRGAMKITKQSLHERPPQSCDMRQCGTRYQVMNTVPQTNIPYAASIEETPTADNEKRAGEIEDRITRIERLQRELNAVLADDTAAEAKFKELLNALEGVNIRNHGC